MVNCLLPLKACTVVIHDLKETAHTLDVTTATLYEAVAQALAAARGQRATETDTKTKVKEKNHQM
jgi:hypothetical protein